MKHLHGAWCYGIVQTDRTSDMPSSKNSAMHAVWKQTATNLEKVISPQNYTNWIQPIQFSHADNQALYLLVPNQFFKEWLEDNYVDLINSALSVTADKNMLVTFLIQEKEADNLPLEVIEAPQQKKSTSLKELDQAKEQHHSIRSTHGIPLTSL